MKKKEQKEKQVNVDYEIEQKRNSNKEIAFGQNAQT